MDSEQDEIQSSTESVNAAIPEDQSTSEPPKSVQNESDGEKVSATKDEIQSPVTESETELEATTVKPEQAFEPTSDVKSESAESDMVGSPLQITNDDGQLTVTESTKEPTDENVSGTVVHIDGNHPAKTIKPGKH